MSNTGLIVLGIIILGLAFYVNNILFTPQEIQQLELANYLCNSEVFGIPVGHMGQAMSPDIANKCNMINQFMPVVQYRMYIYGLGILLIIIGAVVGRGKSKPKEEKKEVIERDTHIKSSAEIKAEDRKEEVEHIKILKSRYAKGEITKKQFEQMKKDLE